MDTDTPGLTWTETAQHNPEQDLVVETCIRRNGEEFNRAKLKRNGRLWFYPDNHMYVYYTPTHWRYVQ